MTFGFFFVHPVPLPPSELGPEHSVAFDGDAEVSASFIYQREDDSRTCLLRHGEEADIEGFSHWTDRNLGLCPARRGAILNLEEEPLRPGKMAWHGRGPDISGLKMWATVEFWLLFMAMASRMCLASLCDLDTDIL